MCRRNKTMLKRKEKFNFFKKAGKEKWALGQFNVSNLETMRAIFLAAQNLKSPVIIGTSQRESEFIGLAQTVALTRAFEEETGVPAILNLDHAKDLDYIIKALSAGYDAIHFDGSALDLSENIENTRKVVSLCRKKGVLVEAEIDLIPGASKILEKAPENIAKNLTNPESAEKFLKETKVDSLAVNIGTFHGVDAAQKDYPVDIERLVEIKSKVGDKAFLVLHGGSGVSSDDIKNAIAKGIVKINVNTDLRIALTRALKESLNESPNETTPYKYMSKSVEAVRKVVEQKITLFNSQNKF